MCVPLRACWCCLPLEIGCVLISVFMIIYRLLLLLRFATFGENDGDGKEWDMYADSTIYFLFIAIGVIIPVILLLGVCLGSSMCLLIFIVLEVIWLFLFIVWYISTNWGVAESEDVYDYNDHFYNDVQHLSNMRYIDDDDDEDVGYGAVDYDEDEGKTRQVFHDIKNFFRRNWWILPLLALCTSCYFLWVAYSLYRYWREEEYYYYDDEPYYDHDSYDQDQYYRY